MADPAADTEFLEALGGYFDGTLSDAAALELRRQMKADPAKRELYVAVCLQGRLVRELLSESLARPVEPVRWRPPAAAVRWAAAVAIVVGLVAVFATLVNRAPRQAAAAGPFATLIDVSSDARWDRGDLPTAVGSQLGGGWLKLQSGTAHIEFTSGASVTLTGPTEFGVNSAMRGFLRRGHVLATCPPSAHGFTVGAPGCAVIDLGTQFSLAADAAGRTDVKVLKGRVRVDVVDSGGVVTASRQIATDTRLTIGTDRIMRVQPVEAADEAGWRSLPVRNPSFELEPIEGYPFVPTGWIATIPARTGTIGDALIPTGITGRLTLFINSRVPQADPPVGAAVFQDTGVAMKPGTTYRLRVDVGRRVDLDEQQRPPSPYRIALCDTATGAVIAEKSGEVPASGAMHRVELSYIARESDAGRLIQIRLSNPAAEDRPAYWTQTSFDNVRLHVAGEPGAPNTKPQ